jgi:hypothetical protein
MPQADFDKVASYQQIAQGVLGTVLRYEEEEILGQYDRFCQTCLEWREEKNSIPAMQMAEEFAPQDNEETANALDRLFLQRLAAFIKNASRAQVHSCADRRIRRPAFCLLAKRQSAETTAGIRPPEPCLAGGDRPLSGPQNGAVKLFAHRGGHGQREGGCDIRSYDRQIFLRDDPDLLREWRTAYGFGLLFAGLRRDCAFQAS